MDHPLVAYDGLRLELRKVDRWTKEHINKRPLWAHKYANWMVKQWSSVIWSDGSWFTVIGNHDGTRVIRKVGERYEAKHIVPTKKYGGGGVMIWSCFHANGFGPFWSWLTAQLIKTNISIFKLKTSIPGLRNSTSKRTETSYSKRMELARKRSDS
ncbi:hypothetical protein G6F70_000718 [Rhizopus microsporus]|nr:hypothetical protein G6F71_004209 [Rhizopus microsporus]KAG1204147.1 hypothetical protein G6F70_000718 [Rhizopus microsporus]KAG1211935.1 hypothetical protein G6F69_004150 [Rhizopus microsporus]KAG1234798.1 hypothetical protein G6F67_003252 [Rhizopus microsporus]KAG1266140.1 hypothetical protein G6F68_002996 [Rhizopus microsporus]